MFAASWNEKYEGKSGYSQDLKYEFGEFEDFMSNPIEGYKVGDSDSSLDNSVSVEGSTNDSLYVPHTSDIDECFGYWLASPSAYLTDFMLRVYYNGYVDGNDYGNDYNFGVRPVVSLKSEILGTKTGSTWELSSNGGRNARDARVGDLARATYVGKLKNSEQIRPSYLKS